MGEEKRQVLNRLLDTFPAGTVLPTRWLTANGYADNLLPKYVRSGWLEPLAHGVYRRPGATTTQWQDVVEALQHRLALPLHVGGATALDQHGTAHYVRLGEGGSVMLHGPVRPPGWVTRLSLPERFEWRSRRRLFDFATDEVPERAGLVEFREPGRQRPLRTASEERAILELLDEVPRRVSVEWADAAMQSLPGLRPARTSRLLAACRSYKVKRLFLALAHRHEHAWLKHLDLSAVDLGRGKRMLVPGGKLDKRFKITLPANLDAHLG
jgi:hypothetical protein